MGDRRRWVCQQARITMSRPTMGFSKPGLDAGELAQEQPFWQGDISRFTWLLDYPRPLRVSTLRSGAPVEVAGV